MGSIAVKEAAPQVAEGEFQERSVEITLPAGSSAAPLSLSPVAEDGEAVDYVAVEFVLPET